MTDVDVTVDGNLTSMSALASTDRFLVVDDGTTTLQDLAASALLATAAETTTGTSAVKVVTPDGFAGSDYGKRCLELIHTASGSSVATGDGTQGILIPAFLNGHNIIDVMGGVHTKGVTGTTDIQIRRRRAGSDADVLSTKVTIGDEFYANDEVINTSNDDLATGDMLFVDVDAVHSGTAPKGLTVAIICQLP